jgi:hypothetical protein
VPIYLVSIFLECSQLEAEITVLFLFVPLHLVGIFLSATTQRLRRWSSSSSCLFI